LALSGEDWPAEIAGKGRAELRDRAGRSGVTRKSGIVLRQCLKSVRRGLVVGAIEFGAAILARRARLQRPNHRAEHGDPDYAAEARQHLSRQPGHVRPLGPQPQLRRQYVVGIGARIAHHSFHPSVRTIRTFC
jgi:hypothetical protein